MPEAILVFLLGLGIGIVMTSLIWEFRKTDGTIIVDKPDSNTIVYRLEVDSLDVMEHNKFVVFKIRRTHN